MPAKKKAARARKRLSQKSLREAASRSIDERIMKALGNRLRVEILAILNDRIASPNELSKELGEGLSQVSYHVQVLKDNEMVEMIKTEPRRGAVEHYYRASTKVFVPVWVMRLIPKSLQRQMFGDVLADIEQDVGNSLETGTFDNRPDWVVGRDPRNLDGKAREDAEELAAEFYKGFEQLEVESIQLSRTRFHGDRDWWFPIFSVDSSVDSLGNV